eukprot:TRINITY_DN36698_c0_g1_i1.p2 TRINITY_DN36698_c0_g1~~TRINITY_DN36698_c0_g1_i1.p2  ORF type:complete len:161 (-),score=14.53 TRINITY_DN36698_c0_g1_i1:167-649(-)
MDTINNIILRGPHAALRRLKVCLFKRHLGVAMTSAPLPSTTQQPISSGAKCAPTIAPSATSLSPTVRQWSKTQDSTGAAQLIMRVASASPVPIFGGQPAATAARSARAAMIAMGRTSGDTEGGPEGVQGTESRRLVESVACVVVGLGSRRFSSMTQRPRC